MGEGQIGAENRQFVRLMHDVFGDLLIGAVGERMAWMEKDEIRIDSGSRQVVR